MARRKQIKIGTEAFDSAAAATRRASDILNRWPLRERIVGADNAFVADLFDLHPDRDGKLAGRSISHFEVHPFVHGSRCFFLVRDDGTWVDLSYKPCIKVAASRSIEDRQEKR